MSHVSGWCCAPEGFRPQCERCKVPACAHGCHESSSRAGDCDVREGVGRKTIKGEPDRSVSALQPGSDHLLDTTERG